METNQYEYYAFISYKREDEKWAKWLQKKLESYGFPVSLRKDNPALPSKIRPVFRDQSELSGGNLKEEIEKGLKGSKYLIVICSPRSARSPWVSKEVQYFLYNHKEDSIIPFIIGGTPNSSKPEDECFPEGLRMLSGEKEILGININEMGREAALVKVIARMFDLRFDSLWQRHERAKRRNRVLFISGVAAFAICGYILAGIMTSLKKEAELQTSIAKTANQRANRERDNALRANEYLKVAYDSIRLQSLIIEQANQDLIEERDNVLKYNWKILENSARLAAGKALQLIYNGNSVLAMKLCLQSLPIDLDNPNKPYVPELEFALRRAIKTDCVSINGESIGFGRECRYFISYVNTIMGGRFYFWDCRSGQLIKEYESIGMPNKYVLSLGYDYCPNLNMLAYRSTGYGSVVYDFNTSSLIAKIPLRAIVNKPGLCFKFSKDGSCIASISRIDDCIRLWDTQTGQCLKSFKKPDGFESLEFDSRGNLLAAWNPYTPTSEIVVFDTSKDEIKYVVPSSGSKISKIRFSPDNNVIAIISEEGNACIYDTVKRLYTPQKMSGHVKYITFNNANLIAYGSDRGEVWISDLNGGNKEYFNVGASVSDMMFTSDDELFVYCEDNTIKRLRNMAPNDYNPSVFKNCLADFKYNGSLVASYYREKGMICIEDIFNKNKIVNINKNLGEHVILQQMSFSPDGKELVLLYEGVMEIWDTDKGKELFVINKNHEMGGDIDGFVFNNNFGSLLIQIGNEVGILDLYSKKYLKKIVLDSNKERCMCSNGRYVALAADGIIDIWSMDGEKLWSLSGHTDHITELTFNSDGGLLASASKDKSVRLWNMNTGKCIAKLEGHDSEVSSIAFSKNNGLLASGDTKGILRIWDMKSYVCLDMMGRIPYKVYRRQDGSDHVWERSSDEIFTIRDIRFSDDDKKVYTVGHKTNYLYNHDDLNDYALLVWKRKSLQEVINEARAIVK